MRKRRWPVTILIVAVGALTLGSCAGAMIGRYTVTGMMPLAPVPSAIEPSDAAARDRLFDSPYSDAATAD